jgi:hypothetical protein
MDNLIITMKKSKSTKRFDVYEAERPDAYITSVYLNKAANAPENITITVAERA